MQPICVRSRFISEKIDEKKGQLASNLMLPIDVNALNDTNILEMK